MSTAEIIGGVAILDANIVYPIRLTDFLLTAAEVQLIRPLVSPAIVEEARRNLLKDQPSLDPARVDLEFPSDRGGFGLGGGGRGGVDLLVGDG
jgi:hypothetical protein